MKPHLKILILLAVAILCVLLFTSCAGPIDKEATKILMDKLGNTSVTIFPTYLRQKTPGYDSASAADIGQWLVAEKLATVSLSNEQVPITSQWGMNQARMFRESAGNLSSYVKQHPLATDYATMAEYLFNSEGAVGIHCYVVDREGRLAEGFLLNSHQKVFTDVGPKSPADCTRVLLAQLKIGLEKKNVAEAQHPTTKVNP